MKSGFLTLLFLYVLCFPVAAQDSLQKGSRYIFDIKAGAGGFLGDPYSLYQDSPYFTQSTYTTTFLYTASMGLNICFKPIGSSDRKFRYRTSLGFGISIMPFKVTQKPLSYDYPQHNAYTYFTYEKVSYYVTPLDLTISLQHLLFLKNFMLSLKYGGGYSNYFNRKNITAKATTYSSYAYSSGGGGGSTVTSGDYTIQNYYDPGSFCFFGGISIGYRYKDLIPFASFEISTLKTLSMVPVYRCSAGIMALF